ncbi:MAG: DUF1461 domain-containing protein [archaeon]|nr:DUF1461 domain-containing protein [Nanoarchaeota archaeon]
MFSYKLALLFTSLDDNQQLVMDFLNKPVEFEEQLVNITETFQTANGTYSIQAITEQEISHLNDVSKLMTKLEYFFLLSLIICSLLYTQHRKNKYIKEKMILYGGIASLALTVIIVLFAAISFNFSFNIFHQIFFPQGNWTFPLESFLITTFPIKFFTIMTIKIALISLLIGTTFTFLGYYNSMRKSKRP